VLLHEQWRFLKERAEDLLGPQRRDPLLQAG